jgi:hypothetical protein
MKNTIRLDGVAHEFTPGETILQIAERAGIPVPTLCWSPITHCGGRCMVCAVRRCEDGAFLPACITKCVPGMNLESSSPQVQAFRRSAIELLLSEHRGDCEAPCRLVCPQNLDIPAFFGDLSQGSGPTDFSFNPRICAECGGKCEKACRRGRLDTPLAVRAVLLTSGKPSDELGKPRAPERRYQHFLGKITPAGICEYYSVTVVPSGVAMPPASSAPSADPRLEARRCLQCACSAANDCVLRDLADRLKARRNAFPADPSALLIPVRRDTIVFDPGKCIKCHRCVELGKQLKPAAGPVMSGRGKDSIIAPPLNADFAAAFAGCEEDFIAECPTGALGRNQKKK